jgi:hypothetical protein
MQTMSIIAYTHDYVHKVAGTISVIDSTEKRLAFGIEVGESEGSF